MAVAPAWVPTTAIPTPALQPEQSLAPPAWSSTTQVGASSGALLAGNLLGAPWSSTTVVNIPTAAGPLRAPGWSVSTTIPSGLSVAGALGVPGWAPTTAVRGARLAGPVTAPVWPVSTSVFTPAVAAPVVAPAWTPTTLVSTPTIDVAQVLTTPVWSATTTVTAPQLNRQVRPGAWASSTQVYSGASVVGPLAATRVNAATQVFTPGISRFVDFGLTPTFGLVTGGANLTLTGSSLDMGMCTPDFTDGTLDVGFWTDLSSGSGEVLEVASLQSLRLNTGVTAGSVAGVRTVLEAADLDIEVQATALVGSTFELALYVNANTDLRLLLQGDDIILRVRENGLTSTDQVIGASGGSPLLRLLRVNSTVQVFLGGAFTVSASWVASFCRVELVTRESTGQSAVRVSRYLRRPVVVIDDTPLAGVEVVSSSQALATIPARTLPGTLDVRLTGCDTGSDTLANAFTYVLDARRSQLFDIPNGARLTTLSDPVLTGHIGRST